MSSITENVHFDTIAREWRCKWTPDNDKKSLVELQKALDEYIAQIKEMSSIKSVQRVVCGTCMDFKVICSMSADDYQKWEENDFKPEKDFLEKIKNIDGVSQVETQTYTLMSM